MATADNQSNNLPAPQHIAIIMDGNGRWAKKRGLPRTAGHAAGAESFRKIANYCRTLGVKYLTVYAFSTENWKRSEDEVDALMQLFRYYAKRLLKIANENNVRVKFIGDISRFAPDIIEGIRSLEETSAKNTGLTFCIAVNYGSRDEIRRGMTRMMEDCREGKILPSEVTEETISSYLDTADMPDPDLLIRTSGEERLSNFLLWQLAYSEFYFADVLWPDFNKDELVKAIEAYNGRDRRFGNAK